MQLALEWPFAAVAADPAETDTGQRDEHWTAASTHVNDRAAAKSPLVVGVTR